MPGRRPKEVRLLRDCGAIGAWIRSAEIKASFAVVKDRLAAPHKGCVIGVHLQQVSHLAECCECGWRHTRLDHDSAAELLAISKARFFHCCLNIHMVVDDVRNKLCVS